jgi:dephospho-CoA kinase
MVVEAFGDQVLGRDGSLDRGALRERAFGDARQRERLEAILHPRIRALRDAWMREQDAAGEPLVVAEIPLLFEVGMEGEFDAVILIDAPEEERLRRLIEERGLTERAARSIMDAQMPSAQKRSRADFVLDNGGTREELEDRALALLDLLRARSRKGGTGS